MINNISELGEGRAKKIFSHLRPIYCKGEILGAIINLSNFVNMLIKYPLNKLAIFNG